MKGKYLRLIVIIAAAALFIAALSRAATIKKMDVDSMNEKIEKENRRKGKTPVEQSPDSAATVDPNSAFYPYYMQVHALRGEVEELKAEMKKRDDRIETLEYKTQYLFTRLRKLENEMSETPPPAETPAGETP